MKEVIIYGNVPLLLARIIKFFYRDLFITPKEEYDYVSNLIEDGQYDKALEEIYKLRKKWGITTEFIRLETRAYRIKLLGK